MRSVKDWLNANYSIDILGEQFVLKSEKARKAYLIEMEKNPLSGTFIQDLIRGEVKL